MEILVKDTIIDIEKKVCEMEKTLNKVIEILESLESLEKEKKELKKELVSSLI